MSQNPHLSVSDYLLRARVLPPRPRAAGLADTSQSLEFARHLVDALDSRDPFDDDETRPMTLADYRARPVALHPDLRARMRGLAESGSPGASLQAAAPKTGRDAIDHHVRQAAERYDLPPELIRAVIQAESNFDPAAVSLAGAQGLMQLMPATAEMLGVNNPFDIGQNIDGGARYLRQMLDRFEGELPLALAAYNAGPGAVERHGGTVPPYRETTRYVDRVLRFAQASV